jgi:hypothetical protein
LSDLVWRRFSDDEIDNFKRWSSMFTTLWEWSNTVLQMNILLQRWNFNNPEDNIRCLVTNTDVKITGKFLKRWYSTIFSRKTSRSFVKDKRDWRIDYNLVEASGRHASKFKLNWKQIEEINNYKSKANNVFKYKNFLEFIKKWNTRDYFLFLYRVK